MVRYRAIMAFRTNRKGVICMVGRKFYVAVLLSMALIAAIGLWAMVDGAIAYRERPRLETSSSPGDAQSSINTRWYMGGISLVDFNFPQRTGGTPG